MFEWHKKEKPLFTGFHFGFGGGAGGGVDKLKVLQQLVEQTILVV